MGTQLPVKRELAEEYGAAIGTVDSALRVLRQLEVAESRQGSGTFVVRQHPGETRPLAEQVDTLRAEVAELARRAEEGGDLREIVSRIEGNLIELYGKTGFDYPADGTDQRDERTARHG